MLTHERKRNPIPNFVAGEQTQTIRFTTAEFRVQLKLSRGKLEIAAAGDQTRVTRVTGGNSHHYTTTTFEKYNICSHTRSLSTVVRKSNPIKIVKTKLNLLLLGGSNSGHSSDKQEYSPLYYNDLWNIITRVTGGNAHQCTTTTTSENVLFVNTRDFINHFLVKAIQSRLSSNDRCWGSNPNYRHDGFTAVQFRIPSKLPG